MNEVQNKKQFIQTIIILSIIFYYYLWTAIPESNNFDPRYNIYNYYNKLTDAFLRGQLNLLEKPAPELLAFPNPYDPKVDPAYKLWDASLYKGKYYLYFGPTPVLTLYIPYRILFGKELSDYLAVLIFMFGGVIYGSLILLLIREKYFRETPFWILLLSVAVLGFCNLGPFNLRRLAQYQVAIASGCFFTLGGLYYISYALHNEQSKRKFLLIGSLFLGLAIGAKPTFIFTGASLIIVYLKFSKEIQPKNIFLPFLLCILSLGLYNYLRFDNPFEVGHRYQLSIFDQREVKYFNHKNLTTGLYFYLLHPPAIDSKFPFVHAYSFTNLKISTNYYKEKIVGIFPSIPFILILLIYPLIFFLAGYYEDISQLNANVKFPSCEFMMSFLPGVLILILYMFSTVGLMRYITEFISFIIISSAFIFFYLNSILNRSDIILFVLKIFFVLTSAISIGFGIAFGIEGCEYDSKYGLKGYRAEEFAKLEKLFEPVSSFIYRQINKN